MSKFTKEMIDQYAAKLFIRLSADENTMVLNEFQAIEESMNLINNITNLNNYDSMSHPYLFRDVNLRADIAEKSIPVEAAFINSDKINGREVEIPRVVE